MSYSVTAMVRAARLPKTMKRRPEAKGVLFALANLCDHDGRNAWPSVATIAAEVEIGTRTTDACLVALRNHGVIIEQAPPRQHRPRTWRLDLVVLAALADTQRLATLNTSRHAIPCDSERPADGSPDPHISASDPQDRSSDPQNRESGSQALATDPVLLIPSLEPSSTTQPTSSRAEAFVERFKTAYSETRGIRYRVMRDDDRRVTELLEYYDDELLFEMAMVMFHVRGEDDSWIAGGDRGIGVLSHRATWLAMQTGSAPESRPSDWDRVLDLLSVKLPSHDFAKWWKPTYQLAREEGRLIVAVDGTDHEAYLRRHYGQQFQDAVGEAGMNHEAIVFRSTCRGISGPVSTAAHQLELRGRAS